MTTYRATHLRPCPFSIVYKISKIFLFLKFLRNGDLSFRSTKDHFGQLKAIQQHLLSGGPQVNRYRNYFQKNTQPIDGIVFKRKQKHSV